MVVCPMSGVPRTVLATSLGQSASGAKPSGKKRLLPEVFESLISRLLYSPTVVRKIADPLASSKNDRAGLVDVKAHHAIGLTSPIWWWTHRVAPSPGGDGGVASSGMMIAATTKEMCVREAKMIWHLLQWFQYCGVDMSSVSVLTMPDVVAEIGALGAELKQANPGKKELPDNFGAEVISLPQYALRYYREGGAASPPAPASTSLQGQIRIVSFGTTSTPSSNIATFSEKEEIFAEFMQQATQALVVISDGGWLQPTVPWESLRSVRSRKIGQETVEEFNGLIGNHLPVCCPQHHILQRKVVSGTEPFHGFCTQLCLRSTCGNVNHCCVRRCHPAEPHTGGCPFTCAKIMPCGHQCKVSCGEPCNCLESITSHLPCSHKEVAGYDKSTKEATFAEIEHSFKGTCRDLAFPCAVNVPTPCVECLAIVQLPCALVGQGAAAHAVCEECKKLRNAIRTECRIELLQKAEKEKEERRKDFRRTSFEQRKAAKSGIFKEGQRLIVKSNDGIRDPLEDEFPSVGEHWVPAGVNLEGEQCTVIDRHVDITDLDEIQYLVKFSDGNYALVADSALGLVRALTSGSSTSTGAPLMITAGAAQGGTQPAPEVAAASAAPKVYDDLPALGSFVLFTGTVEVDDESLVEPIKISNKAVTVLGHASPTELIVEIVQPVTKKTEGAIAGPVLSWADDVDGEPSAKKRRLDATDHVDLLQDSVTTVDGVRRVRTIVPAAEVEPMHQGQQQLVVIDPTKQAVSLSDKQAIPSMGFEKCQMSGLHRLVGDGSLSVKSLFPSRVLLNESCAFIGVVNEPLDSTLSVPGPYYVLRPQQDIDDARRARQLAKGAGQSHVPRVIFVHIDAVAIDEQFEQEQQLDKEALQELESIAEEKFKEKVSDRRLKNEELTYRKLLLMRRQRQAEDGEKPVVFSIPVPLLDPNVKEKLEAKFATSAQQDTATVQTALKQNQQITLQARSSHKETSERFALQHRKDLEADDAFFKAPPVASNGPRPSNGTGSRPPPAQIANSNSGGYVYRNNAYPTPPPQSYPYRR